MGTIAALLAVPFLLAVLFLASCAYFAVTTIAGVFVDSFFDNPYRSAERVRQTHRRGGPLAGVIRTLFLASVWGIAGYVGAFVYGIVYMIPPSPPYDPNDSLANEWYTPYCILLALLVGSGGGLIAFLVGGGWHWWRAHSFTCCPSRQT